MSDTELLYDPETERHLLGAILDQPAEIWSVRQIVRAHDFADMRAAEFYKAMCAVADMSHVPDVIEVNDYLVKSGNVRLVPLTYAHEVTGLGMYGYRAMSLAEIVRKHGERRRLLEATIKIQEIAAAGDDGAGDIIERSAALLDELRDGTLRKSQPIGSAFGSLVDAMRSQIPHVPTPWPSLNAMIGGIRPGALYTVAAMSGHGKSVFGLQLAQHIAELGGRVGYVSLEMSEQDLLKRLISMMMTIHQNALQNHQLSEEGWAAVMKAKTAIEALPLEIYDRPGAMFEDIVGFARALHRKGGLRLLVVDFFGLVASPPGAPANARSQILNGYAYAFKNLARELGISVLLLEQLNRESTKRTSPRPIIQDIRGTAALEHASDGVILMHRVEKKIAGHMVATGDIDFILAKNRQGPPGERTMLFQGEYARITQKEHETTALYEPGEV